MRNTLNGHAERNCEICASAYRPNHTLQRTCGRACGFELRRRRPITRDCVGCGAPVPTTAASRSVLCGPACPGRVAERATRPCRECGLLITAPRLSVCSPGCAKTRKAHGERQRGVKRAIWAQASRRCPRCAVDFQPGHAGQVYCALACKNRARRARERSKGMRAPTHRDRARRLGRRYEVIDPRSIFERDKWICQICRKRIHRAKKAPHPMSPTLDHIIPLSVDGGDHVAANVQTAHFLCNSRRGTGGTVQLLLVG